jgi:hypothetical protein
VATAPAGGPDAPTLQRFFRGDRNFALGAVFNGVLYQKGQPTRLVPSTAPQLPKISLPALVGVPEIAAVIRPLRPRVLLPRLDLAISQAPNQPQIMGTAFDYLLRFELGRRGSPANTQSCPASSVTPIVVATSLPFMVTISSMRVG